MKVRLPKGMGGGPQDMNSMIKQAQKMQENMEALQAELHARNTPSRPRRNGTVVITGTKQIKTIEIKPDIVDPRISKPSGYYCRRG